MRRPMTQLAVGTVGVIAYSTATFGLRWDIDMADSQSVKGYERAMAPLPEGMVSQENVLTPRSFTQNYGLGDPAGRELVSPLQTTDATLATGQRMYDVYCTPCHGADGVELGPVGMPGRYPGVAQLLGDNGRVKMRTDGDIYLTIRNGRGIMPTYGWAMTDEEIWSVVHYLRSQPDGAYIPPEPVEVTP